MFLGRRPRTGSCQGHPTAGGQGSRRRVRAMGRGGAGGRDPSGWVSGAAGRERAASLRGSGSSAEVGHRVGPGAELHEWEAKSGGRLMVRSLCVCVLTPAHCWLLMVKDEFVRKVIGLSFRELMYPGIIDHLLMKCCLAC